MTILWLEYCLSSWGSGAQVMCPCDCLLLDVCIYLDICVLAPLSDSGFSFSFFFPWLID